MRQLTSRSVLTIFATAFWWPLAVAAVLTLSESPAHADPSTQVPPPAQTDSALDLPLDLPSSDVSPAKGAPNRESTPDRGSLFQFTVPLEIKAE